MSEHGEKLEGEGKLEGPPSLGPPIVPLDTRAIGRVEGTAGVGRSSDTYENQSKSHARPPLRAAEAHADFKRADTTELKEMKPKEQKQRSAQEDLEAIEELLEAMEKGKSMNLDPNGVFMKYWDAYMMLLLIFTAIVTPYEVALLDTELNALFYLNRVVDVSFIMDMVMVQPVLSYYDEESAQMIHAHSKILSRCVTPPREQLLENNS